VVKSVAKKFSFPKPKKLFSIRDFGLGGWTKVQGQFFNPTGGLLVKIERNKKSP
jgi:ABC-type sulfate transport system substrate-binding protein